MPSNADMEGGAFYDLRERADTSRGSAGFEPARQRLPGSHWIERIAVRTLQRIVIVPVADIVRFEAEDNYVRIWTDRAYLHKDTLTRLMTRLDPQLFLRVHRSHVLNMDRVRELHPRMHGEYLMVLADGTEVASGRSYRSAIQHAFGLGSAST